MASVQFPWGNPVALNRMNSLAVEGCELGVHFGAAHLCTWAVSPVCPLTLPAPCKVRMFHLPRRRGGQMRSQVGLTAFFLLIGPSLQYPSVTLVFPLLDSINPTLYIPLSRWGALPLFCPCGSGFRQQLPPFNRPQLPGPRY